MFSIVDRRYGSTLLALYGSGSVQRSIGRYTAYIIRIPSTGTYTVPYRFVLSSAANPVYTYVYRIPLTDSAEGCALIMMQQTCVDVNIWRLRGASPIHPAGIGTASRPVTSPIYITSIKIIKNEIGCRDDTVPKTVDTRRHCEED